MRHVSGNRLSLPTLCLLLFIGLTVDREWAWADESPQTSPTSSSTKSQVPFQKAKTLMGQGLQLMEQARYEQAVDVFRQALEIDPTLETARYDLGVATFSLNKWEESRQAFEAVLLGNPEHRFARYFLARLDVIQGNLESATRGFQELAAKEPVADELYYLGTVYFRKGEMQQAIGTLKKASEQKPADYRIPFLLARAYQKTGQVDLGKQQAALSEKLRNSYRQKSREILDCNTALNSPTLELALQQCRQLLDGEDPTKLVSLGVLLAERHFYEIALPSLEKAVRLDPENYEPQFNLGLTYFKMKKYPEAKVPLEMAVSLRPESYDAVALLGSLLFALGEDYAAVQHLRHAHQLRSTDEKVKSLLFEQLKIIAQHLFANQNYRESADYFKEALTLKPQATELQSQLAQAIAALRENEPPRHQGTKKRD